MTTGRSTLLLMIFLCSFITEAFAQSCPEWIKHLPQDIPQCPKNGGILPETFPLAALVVSDIGNDELNGDKVIDDQFTSSVVEKTLSAATVRKPLILLPVRSESFSKIKSMAQAKDYDYLIDLNTNSYTWQQDYFTSSVKGDGKIQLHELARYNRSTTSFKTIADTLSACGMQSDNRIRSGASENGYSGGNFIGLPGGLCLYGDQSNPDQTYVDEVCGVSIQDQLRVSTSWLSVGHADEILKVIKNKRNANACNFTIAIASPRKALELLKSRPRDSFVEFPFREDLLTHKYDSLSRIMNDSNLQGLCVARNMVFKDRAGQRSSYSEDGSRSLLSSHTLHLEFTEGGAKPEVFPKECENITNGDVVQILTSNRHSYQLPKYLKLVNQLIQTNLDNTYQILKSTLESKLNCTVDFLEVPNLFYADHKAISVADGQIVLGKINAKSLLPNPTNALAVEDTVIFPEPGNAAFKKYLEVEVKKRGLKAQFVDSYYYGHLGNGNLHCTTNAIRICRPQI